VTNSNLLNNLLRAAMSISSVW